MIPAAWHIRQLAFPSRLCGISLAPVVTMVEVGAWHIIQVSIRPPLMRGRHIRNRFHDADSVAHETVGLPLNVMAHGLDLGLGREGAG